MLMGAVEDMLRISRVMDVLKADVNIEIFTEKL